MHLSTHTWMRPEPLEKTLSRISRLGYNSIELEGEPGSYDIPSTRRLLDKHGIKCWGAVTIMQGNRDLIASNIEVRKATVQYMKDVITLSASLDGKIVTVVPSLVGKLVPTSTPENEWAWAVEGLREVAAFARGKNIRLALEPLNRFETYFLNRTDQAIILAEAVGDNVGIAFDPFHLALEERDIFDAIRACGSRIADVHIADHNRLAAGDGSFDWPRIMTALRDVGYEGGLAVECMPPIDRTPVGAFGSDQLEKEVIDVDPERMQFIIDHGSGIFTDEYYTSLIKRSAETMLPLIEFKSCVYSERIQKTRPSNKRISALEEHIKRLQQSLQISSNRSSDAQVQNPNQELHSSTGNAVPHNRLSDTPPDSGVRTRSNSFIGSDILDFSPSRVDYHVLSTTSHTEFHGPSSAMFDETQSRKEQPLVSGVDSLENEKCQLFATAAKQRQLELTNLASGKLDFDGVEFELGMHLLTVFWNRQHHSGSIVYRPLFMRDMAGRGPYFSKLLLNAIFFHALKSSPRYLGQCDVGDTPAISGWTYRKRIEAILHQPNEQMLYKSNITTIQALLLFSDALLAWCDERSLAWHYSGIAINMIIDLGIHVEDSAPRGRSLKSAEDVEVRRRLFWAAFAADKVQSIYQGRPPRLREVDTCVPNNFLDEYEELEQFDTLSYSATQELINSPTYSVSTFQQISKLSVIMEGILSSLYTQKSRMDDREYVYKKSQSLHDDLIRWKDSLPKQLIVDLEAPADKPLTPQILALQPFVSEGHLHSDTTLTLDAFAVCATAASRIDTILHIYQKHFCNKTAPYFISYATYVSATIHVRIAAQRGPESEAYRSLKHCLGVLWDQRQCLAPKAARVILLGLMRRLGVSFQNKSSEDSNGTQTMRSALDNAAPEGELASEQVALSEWGHQLDFTLSDIDMDAILQSFDVEQQDHASISQPSTFWESATNFLDGAPQQMGCSLDNAADSTDWLNLPDALIGFGALEAGIL
ncbi:MAG: hypothetical protein M1820_005372 [Bogoriella megaspora]|nr:MAG: hypothetical protein M1820_005372 [Bogoriella megaspora]